MDLVDELTKRLLSQAQFNKSPWLQARDMECTTPAELMA